MTKKLAPHEAEVLDVLSRCEVNDVVNIEIHPRVNNRVAWVVTRSKNEKRVLSVAIDT